MSGSELKSKKRYITENFLRSFLYIAVLVAFYILLKKYFVAGLNEWIEYASQHRLAMFGVFFLSELAFGLIPPEVFFVAFPKDEFALPIFLTIMLLMAVMSYLAGTMVFLIGRYLGNQGNFRLFDLSWYQKYKERMEVYGHVLLILACITPVPYATVALVAGSQDYPLSKFLVISTLRLVRFLVYGAVVYYFI